MVAGLNPMNHGAQKPGRQLSILTIDQYDSIRILWLQMLTTMIVQQEAVNGNECVHSNVRGLKTRECIQRLH
jgi:hypothetical protein